MPFANKVTPLGDPLTTVVSLLPVEFISTDLEINAPCPWVTVHVLLTAEVHRNTLSARTETGAVDVVGRLDPVVPTAIASFALPTLERILATLVYFMDVK